jgi:Zn-dependent M28 family amino/carboxypeptidase
VTRRIAVALLLAACSTSRGEELAATSSSTTEVDAAAPDAAAPEPLKPCPNIEAEITREALKRHLENFLQVAKQHDGNRSRPSGGYRASVAYVLSELRDAGLEPTREGFAVPTFEVVGPGVLEMTRPTKRSFLPARNRLRTGEFTPLNGSPPGEVAAVVAAVGIELGLGNQSESGCAALDFGDEAGASRVAGKIALLQRGGCPFVEKVRNAQSAGAHAVLVFNQGDSARRRGLLDGSLDGRGPRHGINIPALFTTTPVAEQLLAAMKTAPVEVRLAADTSSHVDQVHNVILDIPGERKDEVLIFGAHLDSVERGPGMNDNASGAAALIAIARQLRGCKLQRSVRFAWWGAEEEGLLGSTAYVASLTTAQLEAARGYVNLDMLAAPNFAFMLTDGDGSKTGTAAPRTSGELEAFFQRDFAKQEQPLVEVPYAGRSDDKPFYEAGIGVVMLGAGYDGKKSAKQAAAFGGRAGQPFDPCYHKACDDMTNVNIDALETVVRSVARSVQHFGVDGRGLGSGAE